jgi:hypothetical protein
MDEQQHIYYSQNEQLCEGATPEISIAKCVCIKEEETSVELR